MDNILIFIPMYNCEKQIPRVLLKIASLKEKQKYISEILIIDNGSKDGSVNAASLAAEQVAIKTTIIKNRGNVYLGGSHKVALNYSIDKNFDYVIVLHGDDQGNIHDIIPYIENGEYKKYDSFLGSWFHKDSKLINYSRFRIFGNRIFNMLVSIAVRRKVSDLGSGLNMYQVNYLKSQFYMYFPNGLIFNFYLLLYGLYCKSKFTFFPLSWREEDQVSNAKLFSQSMDLLRMSFRYAIASGELFPLQENKYSTMAYKYDVVFEREAMR